MFQRTANYSIRANGPIDEAYAEDIRSNYDDFRQRNKQMFALGADQARSDLSVFEVSDEERETRFEVK